MKKLYAFAARVGYELARPLILIYLHNSRRVRVLVMNDQHILLQKSAVGRQEWSLPGGGVDKNENPMQAAIRETVEETGVHLQEQNLVCIGQVRAPVKKRWFMQNLIFYQATLKERRKPSIVRPLEILDVRWFAIQDLPENCSKTVKIALTMAAEVKADK